MRALLIIPAVLIAGCVPNRYMLWPTTVDLKEERRNYIYIIEQEQQRDSRILKCDIVQGNQVKCAVQYDLD